MLDLSYYMPVRMIYGEDCVQGNQEVFAPFGKTCMLVTGRHSAKASGAFDDVAGALKQNGIDFILFDEVEPNPLLSTCKRAGDIARENHVDFIIGIGGGSPLDAAKAVSVFAANDIENPSDIYDNTYPHLPFFLVGTTAGTGSEVTPYSVLIVDEENRKKTVRGLFAEACFCDYRYTESLNYDVTISTALDALSHCIEGYFVSTAGTLSDQFAIAGIKLILEVLTDAPLNGVFSQKQRQKLYAASLYGGLTITKTGTSFCHSLGYFLTEDYGVAHGVACAVFLPAYLKRGFESLTKKADKLMYELDFTLSELCSLIENFTEFTPFALNQEQREDLVTRWKRDEQKFRTAPGEFTLEDARVLLDILFPEDEALTEA